ncbi:MAG: SDR family oxidoreductase [Rhizobiaceae bacterium]|nr:SDR family oxidoreductase [Rhizobiaceae bacterium]
MGPLVTNSAIASSFSIMGKRALVTGGSRGIGRAAALALAESGAAVDVLARTSADLHRVQADVRSLGRDSDAIECNVLDDVELKRQLGNRPPYDILVNNAGTNRPNPLTEVSMDDFDAVMALNVRSLFRITQLVVPGMVGLGGGSIINISSQMGHVGAANRSVYCASKWAVEGLTRALAVELAPAGVRVNTVCPTFVLTEMTRPFFEDESFRAEVLGKIKLGRLAEDRDLVGAIVFLASQASAMTTGSSIVVDGGWTAE